MLVPFLIIGFMFVMLIGLHIFCDRPERAIIDEAEARRILIWYHSHEHECCNDEEDDKLATGLRKLFKLSPDCQEYPEWN